MVQLADGETVEFVVKRWFSRKQEDFDVWRELAVYRPGVKPLSGESKFANYV
jgi:hypothetical protein